MKGIIVQVYVKIIFKNDNESINVWMGVSS